MPPVWVFNRPHSLLWLLKPRQCSPFQATSIVSYARHRPARFILLRPIDLFPWTVPGRFGYFGRVKYLSHCASLLLIAALTPSPLSGQSGGDRLVLFGDVVYFYPPGHPRNCLLNNQFKRGEPVGFRMNAVNPATGKRDRATELVVHLTYAGRTVDVPMRDRQNDRQP